MRGEPCPQGVDKSPIILYFRYKIKPGLVMNRLKKKPGMGRLDTIKPDSVKNIILN